MTKDSISAWLGRNDEQMKKAADILADGLLRDVVGDLSEDTMLRNATDIEECDGHDLEVFFSLLQRSWEMGIESYRSTFGSLEEKPYSMKEFNRKHLGHGAIREVFGKWLEDNYSVELPADLLAAFDKRCKVAGIVYEDALGGGDYEELCDLFGEAKAKAVEKIKRQLGN